MANKGKNNVDSTGKDLRELKDELWIVLPFFLLALGFFVGSFSVSREAGAVPMAVGLVTSIILGLRLFHILFPQSKIGAFDQGSLAGEFDDLKDKIEEEASKGYPEEPVGKKVTVAEEKKAFLGAIISLVIFLLFGYIVGSLVAIVALSYYYGYREKLPIVIIVASLFLVIYVVLYKLLEGPAGFGLLLKPLLKWLDLL